MWLLLSLLVPLLLLCSEVGANEDAKRLYDDLMVNYNRHRRPAPSPHEPVTIKLKLRLSQIIDVVCVVSPRRNEVFPARTRPDNDLFGVAEAAVDRPEAQMESGELRRRLGPLCAL